MNEFIKRNQLKGVNVYLDNLTVGGEDQQSHDQNLKALKQAALKEHFTFNENKCQYNRSQINLLGHLVGNGVIKPDAERITALNELKLPKTKKELQRILGLFSYYAKGVPNFSQIIRPLVQTKAFPLSEEASEAIRIMKNKLANATLQPINKSLLFTVETDASDFAIGATLNQNGRPVAFHARTLNNAEQKHSSVEKEAYAIIEALRKWKHLLLGRHFDLVTDQRSVSFMLDLKHASKIKNDKILRWRLELAAYDFTTIYRPGNLNCARDTFSRATSAAVSLPSLKSLQELHKSLCHPGITRLSHYIEVKNLPYSLDDVKTIERACRDCCEVKASFLKPKENLNLIKATQPFERLSIDFKGPLQTVTNNKYLLVIIDEFSRFPFVYACKDMKACTVIEKLTDLFSMFGFPGYLHSDQGACFMSYELKSWLHNMGIPTSKSTRYNPQGNGQVERLNRTFWQTVQLALRTKNLPLSHWQYVLPETLRAIRSLLCTVTNCTPHERMFMHTRKSFNGISLPSWVKPGPMYVKRHNRSKNDLLVEEAELIEANSHDAHVRLMDGKEISVSLRGLAPNPKSLIEQSSVTENKDSADETVNRDFESQSDLTNEMPADRNSVEASVESSTQKTSFQENTNLRRSSRVRRPIDRYGKYLFLKHTLVY